MINLWEIVWFSFNTGICPASVVFQTVFIHLWPFDELRNFLKWSCSKFCGQRSSQANFWYYESVDFNSWCSRPVRLVAHSQKVSLFETFDHWNIHNYSKAQNMTSGPIPKRARLLCRWHDHQTQCHIHLLFECKAKWLKPNRNQQTVKLTRWFTIMKVLLVLSCVL
jgi:hypothetical protein